MRKPKTFNEGDILVLKPETRTFRAEDGALARVTAKAVYWCMICNTYLVDVMWIDEKGVHQRHGGYDLDDFALAERPAREPSAPMTAAVLDLLRRKGALTSMEAQGVLRCRQLPARILELKRLGHKIVTEMKHDPTGQKYARYHLQAAV